MYLLKKWPLSKNWLCTIGVQFFLQDPASKLESTSQKLGHVSRVAEFFEVSVVRVPLWWLPTSTMKSKPVQVLPPSIQSEEPVLTSTCFYCGLGGQGFHEGMNQHCEIQYHICEKDWFFALMISLFFLNNEKFLKSSTYLQIFYTKFFFLYKWFVPTI